MESEYVLKRESRGFPNRVVVGNEKKTSKMFLDSVMGKLSCYKLRWGKV